MVQCEICGEEFKNPQGLAGHMKFKHPEPSRQRRLSTAGHTSTCRQHQPLGHSRSWVVEPSNLKMLGWVEATGEEEGSLMGGSPGARVEKTRQGTSLVEVPQPRRFYCLTAAGRRAPDVAWSDPLEALYDYTREQRSRKKAERKLYKPGSLPRGPKPG